MSTHRSATRPPTPPWLKAWYAFLLFMAVVTIVVTLVK